MNLLTIILAVVLALGGFIGGKWFWQKMAESPIWDQLRKYVKAVGIFGALFLFAVAIILVWKTEFFRQHVFLINIGSCFLFFYMLGCDASILRPQPGEMEAPHGKEKTTSKFHIKWDLLIKELFVCIIAIVPAVGLLLLSLVNIYVFVMWIVGVMGFGMGFFFWELLKETNILASTFKRLFLLTTIAIGCIAGYGLYAEFSAGNPKLIQILLVVFTLLIWGLAWYMLALCVVVFRTK